MSEEKFSISKDLLRIMCFAASSSDVGYLASLNRGLDSADSIESAIVSDAFESISGDDRFLFYAFFFKKKTLPKEKELFFRKNVFFYWRIKFSNFSPKSK